MYIPGTRYVLLQKIECYYTGMHYCWLLSSVLHTMVPGTYLVVHTRYLVTPAFRSSTYAKSLSVDVVYLAAKPVGVLREWQLLIVVLYALV